MPKGKGHDNDLLLKVCGEPWKEKVAFMPRSLCMDGGKGDVVPTPLETVGTEAEGAAPGAAPSGGEGQPGRRAR